MAHVLIMPRQGNTVESCIIGEWKVKEGDLVEAETPVCSVETDKAAFEIPAGGAGTVLKILHSSGEDVPVLKPITVIGNPGEDWKKALPAEEKAAGESATDERAVTPPVLPAAERKTDPTFRDESVIAISPRAKRLAEEEAVTDKRKP